MQINLVASPATTTPAGSILDLRLNRATDGTVTLEASGNGGPFLTVLTFPLGKDDNLLRMQRVTGLDGTHLAYFINTGGGNGSILMIRNNDR